MHAMYCVFPEMGKLRTMEKHEDQLSDDEEERDIKKERGERERGASLLKKGTDPQNVDLNV
jgi:hypothetical protein